MIIFQSKKLIKSNISTQLVLKLNSIKYHISLGLFCKIVLLLNEVNLD